MLPAVKPLSPKQREIREREQRILDVAQAHLLERGYVGLSMERVADEIGVSKGTVYQHFDNKEDLVAAVALRTAEIRASLFERAAAFRGRSSDRMAAIGIAAELFFGLYPHHEQAERAIKASSIAQKIGRKRAQGLSSASFRCFGAATGVTRDAVAAGDLVLGEGRTVEQLCVGLWNLYTGAFLMRDLETFLDEPLVQDPMPTLHANAQVLLDGFGWRPHSRDQNTDDVRRRVLNEVFPGEARALGLLDRAAPLADETR